MIPVMTVMRWRHVQETTRLDDSNRTYRQVHQYVVQVRVPRWLAVALQRCGVPMWTE